MPSLLPYGLRKIWSHPANRTPGGLKAWVRCLGRSGSWASYQLQKRLGLFPKQGRVIPWIDGLQVRLLTSSQQSQACLYYGTPDWPSMQFLRRYLRPGDLCADIGANVGIYTLLLARHAGAAHVHSFECLPANIPKLHANLRLNGCREVTVYDVALADRDGLVQLHVSDGDSTTSISPPPLSLIVRLMPKVGCRRGAWMATDGRPGSPTSRSMSKVPSSWYSRAVNSCCARRRRWCGA